MVDPKLTRGPRRPARRRGLGRIPAMAKRDAASGDLSSLSDIPYRTASKVVPRAGHPG